MMHARWQCGDTVRVIRNVRNDGTYPGMDTGAHLIRRGSVGYVIDIGIFLQDQIIYTVHFVDEGRIVGCREEELIDIDEDWIESRFESRERVRLAASMTLDEGIELPQGCLGEVLRVVRQTPERVAYQVHFEVLPGRVFQMPEGLLANSLDGDGDGSRLS